MDPEGQGPRIPDDGDTYRALYYFRKAGEGQDFGDPDAIGAWIREDFSLPHFLGRSVNYGVSDGHVLLMKSGFFKVPRFGEKWFWTDSNTDEEYLEDLDFALSMLGKKLKYVNAEAYQKQMKRHPSDVAKRVGVWVLFFGIFPFLLWRAWGEP